MKDPYLWLEHVEGKRALDWVRRRNAETLATLEKDPRFEPLRQSIQDYLESNERVAFGSFAKDGFIYNFWTDAANPRGLWRRTTVDSYKTDTPDWELLLDIDALNKAENKSWVYHGASRTEDGTRAIVYLSDGGKDACEVREYDFATRSFVTDGFRLSVAKQNVAWVDNDTLLVKSTLDIDNAETDSGYAATVRLWKRGTELADAPVIYRCPKQYMSANAHHWKRFDKAYTYISGTIDFYSSDDYLLLPDGTLAELKYPKSAKLQDIADGYAFVLLRNDWTVDGTTYPQGALVAVREDTLTTTPVVELVASPAEHGVINGILVTKSHKYLSVMNNAVDTLLALTRNNGAWQLSAVTGLPENGELSAYTPDSDNTDELVVSFNNFLTPQSQYLYNPDTRQLTLLKQGPKRFNADGLVVKQQFATSKDGTKVPYFIVHREGLKLDGTNPTLLYGYGGFEVSLQPGYRGLSGKVWMEQGGVYVLANIRGGGELGPAWHQAALKHNRQRAYDDFIAIAEELIATGVTTPKQLVIEGGSNGGLLVGAVMMQRPDLFNGMLCGVPLLDMLRYHTLLAGASWMAEYGDPDNPADRAVLERYSPYQNIRADVTYPRLMITTSTKDDRVHPGHARKMAAKLKKVGADVLYFENMEGGHGAGADARDQSVLYAVEYLYLWQQTGLK